MKDQYPDAEEILSAAEVSAGLERLAAQLQTWVSTGDCLILGILTGGMFPLVHLAELLHGDFQIDYCHASRYAGATEGTALHWSRKPEFPLVGRKVLIVDDIWDEGITLAAVADFCREQGAASVKTAVLVIKDRARKTSMPAPDFNAGLHVPDRYVFGCGMDINNRWRQLSAVFALPDTGRS